MSVGSPELTNNLVKKEKLVEQSRPEEASAQPEQAELKKKVINLKSVLLGPDGINIQYTWVEGGNPDASYTYTLPLGKVQEMVQRGVYISSEGFDDSQGSDVEENLAKLRKFVEDQENLIRERERERELNLLAKTASELSFPDSKNPTEVADELNVFTGDQSSEAFTSPETDTVATQTPEQKPDSGRIESQQTDSSEQKPDSGRIESQQTDSSEQKPDSGERFKSPINETLIAGLKNENYYSGLRLIEDFLTSDEFESSSVSPEYTQLIANAILTMVNRGIESEQLQFVNHFLMEYPACLDILNITISIDSIQTPEQLEELKEKVERLNKAIGMESIQIAEQLKERLTKLFIRIRDEFVKFDSLVSRTRARYVTDFTLSEIIEPDNLSFLKLIYPKITQGISQFDEILQEVFVEPFNEWVEANETRINQIAESISEEVNEEKIAQDLENLQKLRRIYHETSSKLSELSEDKEGLFQYDLAYAQHNLNVYKYQFESIKSRNTDLKNELLLKQSILNRDKQDLSSNGPIIYKVSTKLNDILARVRSLISKLDQIIDFRIQ